VAICCLIFFLVNACWVFASPPKCLTQGLVPVVDIGETEPKDDDYILHIPANKKFPVRIIIHGSLFNQELEIVKQVSINHELFMYKGWSSLDGQDWFEPEEFDKQIQFRVIPRIIATGGTIEIFWGHKK